MIGRGHRIAELSDRKTAHPSLALLEDVLGVLAAAGRRNR